MKKVAFICVHNACRSQIAESLANYYGKDCLEAYSAGTQIAKEINPDANRLMKEIYQVDMASTQSPKLIEAIPSVDYVITMGCHVDCPYLPFTVRREDWGLDDPTGHADDVYKEVIAAIDQKIQNLVAEVRKDQEETNETARN